MGDEIPVSGEGDALLSARVWALLCAHYEEGRKASIENWRKALGPQSGLEKVIFVAAAPPLQRSHLPQRLSDSTSSPVFSPTSSCGGAVSVSGGTIRGVWERALLCAHRATREYDAQNGPKPRPESAQAETGRKALGWQRVVFKASPPVPSPVLTGEGQGEGSPSARALGFTASVVSLSYLPHALFGPILSPI